METKKIEVSYFIRTGKIYSEFSTIFINAKPDITISDAFDAVRRKHKNCKDLWQILLMDVDKLKSELHEINI